MPEDVYGLPLTTESAVAARHMSDATASFNHWRTDVMDHVNAALEADPDFPMAHAFRGLFLGGGRHVKYLGVMRDSLAKAEAGADAVSERERSYIEALQHMVAGRNDGAAEAYDRLLQAHPTDILGHRIAQNELFWMGRADDMRALVERAAPAWSENTPGCSLFLSVRAFSNEEGLQYADAERYGRAAIERDPTDAWGAHAVAHALLMQDRIDDGVAWLEPLSGNWAGLNQIVHHNWWHLCVFLLERGEHERILGLYDDQVRNPESPLVKAMPDVYIDLQNAASLLLRLELRGVDVGARWRGLVEPAEGRIGNHASPFTDAHAAMILAAAGEFAKADELVASMRAFAAEDRGPLGRATAGASLPSAVASIAHRKGEHEAVLAALLPARPTMPSMGGSHAQRDIFYQILVDSCRKLGRKAELQEVLSDIGRIGFEHVAERTLYADAARLAS